MSVVLGVLPRPPPLPQLGHPSPSCCKHPAAPSEKCQGRSRLFPWDKPEASDKKKKAGKSQPPGL